MKCILKFKTNCEHIKISPERLPNYLSSSWSAIVKNSSRKTKGSLLYHSCIKKKQNKARAFFKKTVERQEICMYLSFLNNCQANFSLLRKLIDSVCSGDGEYHLLQHYVWDKKMHHCLALFSIILNFIKLFLATLFIFPCSFFAFPKQLAGHCTENYNKRS